MIGDYEPGADRQSNYDAARDCFHIGFNRARVVAAQTFSSESIMGATVPEVTPSGGTTSGTSPAGGIANRGCSIRVAIIAAVNSSAAARK